MNLFKTILHASKTIGVITCICLLLTSCSNPSFKRPSGQLAPVNFGNQPQHVRELMLQRTVLLQEGKLYESARVGAQIDALITNPLAKEDNQQSIVETLTLLATQELETVKQSANRNMKGWIDLALILKLQPRAGTQSRTIGRWKNSNPRHSFNGPALSQFLEDRQITYKTPSKVAVFLPSRGAYASAAKTIRKGITTASYLLRKQWRPSITFYDTSAAPVEALYSHAVRDGAKAVIGPFDKTNVDRISRSGSLSIPVVALNETGGSSRHNLYQFSLSPEKEITQVASLAWTRGLKNVIVFAPDTRLGDRLSNHFITLWQQFGGNVLDSNKYTPKQADYSVPIKEILKLDESIQRHQTLKQKLRLDIKFEERRRKDIDFIFLIASPREARLIRPQFRFHRASDLVIYSTSKIYEGNENSANDRDLDGIQFCDMPSIIDKESGGANSHAELLKNWPDVHGTHQRLFSLGLDAYQVIPHLERLRNQYSARFNGHTGILSVDNQGHIARQLTCASFKKGSSYATGLAPQIQQLTPTFFD
ncbi:MAG: hypothetical protein A6F71_02795 [Cycloclasticus sp. symbiont of Poecilosclerida sp. M]|nr:MAG: hypothetical protein A6F71_02795 [Cycloclasticus sp. symbiont of Poecilosclerida sp. M]